MSLVYFIVALLLIGVLWQVVNTRISVPGGTKTISNLVLGLIVVGMFLWLVNTYIPMAGSIKTILNIVVVVATCVKVLQVAGLWTGVERLWSNVTHRT